jgi:hypothetical protein
MELKKRIGLGDVEFRLSLPGRRFAPEDRERALWELGIHDGSVLFVTGSVEEPVSVRVQLPAGEVVVDVERRGGVRQLKEAVAWLTPGERQILFASADDAVVLPEGEDLEGPTVALLS